MSALLHKSLVLRVLGEMHRDLMNEIEQRFHEKIFKDQKEFSYSVKCLYLLSDKR